MAEVTTRAATITGPEQLEISEVTVPAVGDLQLLVDVRACGICGSNLHEWRHPELSISAGDGPDPGATGHEIAAMVIEAGEGAGVAPGRRVVLEPNRVTACGACAACVDGRAWFCRTRTQIAVWGFSERMVVPAASAFEVPDGLSDVAATLVEPAACGVHALRHSWTAVGRDRGLEGATIAILGAGVTGLLALVAARHLGAGRVVVAARHPHQAEAARRLGADEVFDTGDDDLEQQLRRVRPELTIEAVGGRASTFELACRTTAPAGEIAVLGLFDEPQQLDVRRAIFRELRCFFPVTYAELSGRHDFDVAIDLLTAAGGAIDDLVTHRYGLREVDAAFRMAADKQAGSLRVVVEPHM